MYICKYSFNVFCGAFYGLQDSAKTLEYVVRTTPGERMNIRSMTWRLTVGGEAHPLVTDVPNTVIMLQEARTDEGELVCID